MKIKPTYLLYQYKFVFLQFAKNSVEFDLLLWTLHV